MALNSRVLLLNQTYEALGTVSVARAIIMMLKNTVTVEEWDQERVLRTPREEIVHGLRRIAQVDSAIKNSEATPRLQMQYLIAELTLPESARWGIFQ